LEADSGKPVAEAQVGFFPTADAKETAGRPCDGALYPREVQAGADGTFQAVLPPGPWNVLVAAPRDEYVYRKLDAARFAKGHVPRKDPFFLPDAWTAVRLQPGAPPADLTFKLRRASLP